MKSAFTLVELIVVLAIIGVLSAASVLGFQEQQKKSRELRRLTDVSTVGVAIESYRSLNGAYPYQTNDPVNEATDGTVIEKTHLTDLVSAGLINSLPKDPRPANSGNEEFCKNYAYAYDWNNNNKLQIDAKEIEPRAWVIHFRSEYTSTTTKTATETISGHHPFEASVYLKSGASWCEPKSAYGIFLGPTG